MCGVSNRERIETDAIPAPRGSGQFELNRGAEHRFSPGDFAVVAAFCHSPDPIEPHMILVNENNTFVTAIRLPQMEGAFTRCPTGLTDASDALEQFVNVL